MAKKKTKSELRMDAKQRPPLRIEAIEPDGEHILIRHDGTQRAAARVIVHTDDIPKLMQGYYCAACFEAQGEAFPEKCWLCGFEMRDKQAEFIGKSYQGNLRLGPQTNADTELAAMEEWAEKNKRNSDPRGRASQIIVPGSPILLPASVRRAPHKDF